MDCRRTLVPALCLLTGTLGCAHDQGAAPVRETQPPPLASGSPYSPSRHDVEGPKRQPMASTCVEAGNYFAGEAKALEKGSTSQEQMRNRARLAFQQAISINPNYVPAYQNLGRLYVDLSDYEHAVATYQKGLTLQPRNGSLWFDLGMCHARRHDWPSALESLQHAVDCDPENRQYTNTLGFAMARSGRFRDSLNCLIRSYGNEAMAQYQLARMLKHLGQIEQCRLCLQTALRLDPSLEAAHELLSQIGAAPAPAPLHQVAYTERVPAGPELQPASAPPSDDVPQELAAVPETPQPQARRCILPPTPGGNWRPAPNE